VHDGVVANVTVDFFLGAAAELASVLRRGGWLIASGFLVEDLPTIRGRLERAGFGEFASESRVPWAILVGRRIV
jgi:ribosomal protein L11 methylase PrmA